MTAPSATPRRARTTWRLALTMAAAVALLSLGAMALQYRLVSLRLVEAQAALLRADLQGLAAQYDQRRIVGLRQALDYRAEGPKGEALFLLLNRDGSRLAGAGDWPEGLGFAAEGFAPLPLQTLTLQDGPWLIAARDLPGDFGLLVGRSLAPVDHTLAALRRGIIGLLAGLLIAGASVGWLAARQVMRRIDRLNALADRVAAGELEARLPGPRSADEFGLLERHIHAMLDRIENLNRATHRLSDTIAHEMRTPLNRMQVKLSQIEGQADLTEALRGEMRQAIRVFDALLDISRAEADQGSGGGLVPVDLSGLASEIWELYAPLAEDKGLIPKAEIDGHAMVLGDRSLIAQALANLLDNAIKYAGPGDALRLTLRSGQPHILTIADTGPGLPEGLGEAIFERFTRAERDRNRGIQGHGLGLALVRAIALRHGVKLSLPATERGLAVQFDWPALPDPT